MSEHIVGVEPKAYNGRKYRSTLEADTAKILDEMKLPWEYETKTYTLQEGFYCPWQKRKVEAVTYTPDFIIGPIMVEMKGFETPDFKIKKKLFFKLMKENEPDAIYHICKNFKQLLMVLDSHWHYLGYCIEVSPKPKSSVCGCTTTTSKLYDSIQQALSELNLKGRSITPILRSLTGHKDFVYGYNWKLKKLTL